MLILKMHQPPQYRIVSFARKVSVQSMMVLKRVQSLCFVCLFTVVSGTNTSTVAGHRACPCLHNYYRTDRFGPCKPCPAGVICTDDSIVLAPGYYWSWDIQGADRVAYQSFVKNLIIDDDNYNSTISTYTGEIPEAVSCPIKGACAGGFEPRCYKGHKGPLCIACDDRFFSRQGVCTKCAPGSVVMLLVTLALILLIIYFIMKTNKEDLESRCALMARYVEFPERRRS